MKTLAAVFLSAILAGCATKEQSAIGNVLYGSASSVPVYRGKVSRKYVVVKEVRVRRKQIAGPNYYDHGYGWVSAAAQEIGADAVIDYDDKRIPGELPLIDPGYFEAWGTAVKFVNGPA